MSPSSRIRSAVSPTSGSASTLRKGRNAISKIATPAIEPSSAPRGTTRLIQSPANASTILITPIAMVVPIATCQARRGSPVASLTGPSTPNTIANSVGVSIPNGIAVTSSRPVRRISRTASHV